MISNYPEIEVDTSTQALENQHHIELAVMRKEESIKLEKEESIIINNNYQNIPPTAIPINVFEAIGKSIPHLL